MDEARPQRIFRDSIFAFTAYTVTAVIGFTLEATQARSFSVYLAPGIGFLLLWRLGTRQWPAVALAAMTALLFRGAQLPFSLFSALTISLTLVLMVHVLRSWGFRSNLSRLRDALHLIGAAALASAGGALAFTVMMTLRDIPNPRFAIASSWIGVFVGMTISAPPFLMWTSRGAGRYDFATVRPLETTFLFLLLFAVCNAAFGETLGTGRAHYPLAFVPFPVLLWIGLRVGPRALVTATSLTAIAAMFGSIRGLGPFTSHTPEANLALDWMFLGSTQLTFLLLASLLTERAEANASLVAAKEHAEAATRAKSEFLSVMNHELRTPLNSILLATDLMLESDLSSEQRDLGRTVIRASEALSALVSDTLDMARIEEGRMELLPIDFSPKELSRGVIDVFAEAAARKQIDLREHLGESVPTTLHGDSEKIRQVLINLVGNALKFTESGAIELNTKCVSNDPGAVEICWEVRDSGKGIAAQNLKSIFEPFTQADGNAARSRGGTGLGLAISSRLVDLMGGTIGVESVRDRGSTFRVRVALSRPTTERTVDVEPEGNWHATPAAHKPKGRAA